MIGLRASLSKLPWTWVLLALVALDIVCRANPSAGALLPWIDAAALFVSIGLIGFAPTPARVAERVPHA